MLTRRVKAVLEKKGHDTYSLPSNAFVFDAIKIMAENSLGALLVVDDGKLAGIFSERDYARKVFLQGKSSKETLIREIMTSPVQVITPECTVRQALSLMTERRIRHLPVLEDDRIVGVVSIGDLVRSLVDLQATEIEHLNAYITGQYPG